MNLSDNLKLMNMAYHSLQEIEKANKTNTVISDLGEKALDLISDYPLYASTSNISYHEAIGIAMFLFGDIEKEWAKNKDIDKAYELYDQYLKDFDEANGNPVCFHEWYNNEYQQIKS